MSASPRLTGRKVIVDSRLPRPRDFLLVKAAQAPSPGNPTSAGVPEELTKHTLVLGCNDPQQVEDAFAKYGAEIAAVVLEPVAGSMNFVRPAEFMRGCATNARAGALIFDEV